MKKFSLLLGTLGGAMAGYILSNDKLRQELVKAKDPEAAAKALGAHLSKDGKKIAHEVKNFVESDDVQKNLKKAKSFAMTKFNEAKKGMTKMVKKGKKATADFVSENVNGGKAPAKKSTKKSS